MNHTIYSADRTTHLKIVVVGLAVAIAMVALSLSSRVTAIAPERAVAVLKAGKPMAMTRSDLTLTR